MSALNVTHKTTCWELAQLHHSTAPEEHLQIASSMSADVMRKACDAKYPYMNHETARHSDNNTADKRSIYLYVGMYIDARDNKHYTYNNTIKSERSKLMNRIRRLASHSA